MKISSVAGTCNRIRVLLGYAEACNSIDANLDFYWLNGWDGIALNHAFQVDGVNIIDYDYFSPPPDVPLIDASVTFRGIMCAYNLPQTREQELVSYSRLRFSDYVMDGAKYGVGCGLAIHARTTDLPNYTKDTLSPMDFVNRANVIGNEIDIFPIFLATDSLAVRKVFIDYYGEENLRFTSKLDPSKHRQSTTSDACADLLACAEASHFFGTNRSSFTTTIEIFRQLKGKAGSFDHVGKPG